MASTASFKQQCPSCEAMVPIRDPGLIGRKIDCPKCKYRFVVEKPDDRDDDDTPAPTKKAKKPDGMKTSDARAPGKTKNGAPAGIAVGKPKGKPAVRRRDEDDEDERPKQKKSGVSMTVLLGAGLGGLALILLVVGGIMLFGGGSGSGSSGKSNSPSSGSSSPPVAQNPGPAVKPPADNKPSGASFIADVTNLLPNDAETVVNYQIDKLHDSGLGQAALAPGAFSEKAFGDVFSFPFYGENGKGVERVVTAISNTNHWVFTVLHAQKNVTIDKDRLIASLQLEAHPAVNGLIAYSVKRDLDPLGTLLVKANRPHEDLQVVQLDERTLVFADPAPMAKFLADRGHPTLKSQPTEVTPPAKNPGAGGPMFPGPGGSAPPGPGGSIGGPMAAPLGPPPGASGPSGPPPGASGPSGPPPGASGPPGPGGPSATPLAPPGAGNSGGMGPGAAQPAAPPATPAQLVGSYLTIDPGMKVIFDRIERSEEAILISAVMPSKDPLVGEFGRLAQGRAASWQASKDVSSDDATRSVLDKVKVFQPQDVAANWVGFGVTAFSSDRIAGVVAMDMGTDLLAKPIVVLLQPFIAAANDLLTGNAPPANGNSPPGMGTGPGAGPIFPPGGRGPGAIGPPGGRSGPPPGASGGPPPGGGTNPNGQFRPGVGDAGPGAGAPVPPMPGTGGTFSPGGTFGPGGNPADPNQGQGPLTLTQDKSLILLNASLAFGGEKMKGQVDQEIAQLITRLRAGAETASSRSRIHELAAALQAYVQANGHFPRGTAARERTAERFVEWAPDQRVSWMAELLPFLGDGEFANLKRRIDGGRSSWQERPNLRAATMLIPQFISHADMTAPALVRYPGVPVDVAVTNYVGVAGKGLDAVDYPANDPRDGIFGYDRETKPGDVKDGLDKTIVLLQIPEGKTPWLAGGGATVRGVSEGPDALTPFVCADYQGRRGTFAIMGDFKVRFIPENTDPNKFVAMCTIAGGEKLDDLDQIAPVVPDDTPAAPPPVAPPDMGPDAPSMPPTGKPSDTANAPAGWKSIVSKECGFSASFPGQPEKSTQQPGADLTITNFLASEDGANYYVSCSEVESAGSDGISLQDRYDLVARQKGKSLKIRREVSLDGHPGIEMYTEDEQTVLNGTARLFIIGNREYTFGVVARGADIIRAKTAQFLDSFKLLDGGAALPGKAPEAPPAPPPPAQPQAGQAGPPVPPITAPDATLPSLGDSAKWQEVPLPGGKFSAVIPGAIAYQDAETLDVKTVIKNEKAPGKSIVVEIGVEVDKPTDDPAAAFAKRCQTIEKVVSLSNMEEKVRDLDSAQKGYQGKEYDCASTRNPGLIVKYRILLVDKQVVQLTTQCSQAEGAKILDAFLDSFKVSAK